MLDTLFAIGLRVVGANDAKMGGCLILRRRGSWPHQIRLIQRDTSEASRRSGAHQAIGRALSRTTARRRRHIRNVNCRFGLSDRPYREGRLPRDRRAIGQFDRATVLIEGFACAARARPLALQFVVDIRPFDRLQDSRPLGTLRWEGHRLDAISVGPLIPPAARRARASPQRRYAPRLQRAGLLRCPRARVPRASGASISGGSSYRRFGG